MSIDAKSAARPVSTAVPARLARVRRGSLAVLVLVVAEYLIGMYVNLFVTIPPADHDHSAGTAIANGPAILATHAVIGLLLGLAALGVLVQAIMARHPGAIAASAVGLLALAFASVAGASFTSSGHPADSMAMSVFTGIGLLCYAANLYLLPPPGRRG
jgi:hypothetical protein